MAHEAASDTLPTRVVGDSPGAPWVATILDGLALTIQRQCDDAWQQLAPGEPVVKTAIPQSPTRWRWNPASLPALFCWADRGMQAQKRQVAQGIAVRARELHVMWIPPPALWAKSERWSSFWVAIDNAITLALESDYSPWTTATALGLPIRDKAELWALELADAQLVPCQLPGVAEPFEAWLWKLTAHTRIKFDVAVKPSPVVPNKIDIITSVRDFDDEGEPIDSPLYESKLPTERWQ
jgi:hypothetical protein